MNATQRMYRAEAKRLLGSRAVFVVLAVFVLFLLSAYVFFLASPSLQTDSYDGRYIYTQSDYERRLEQREQGLTEQYDPYIALYERVKLQSKADYYDVYAAMPARFSYGLKQTNLWSFWIIAQGTGIVFLLICVFLGAWLFREFANGCVKNFLVAGVDRKSVFFGKYLFLLTVETALFLLWLSAGIVFGARYFGYRLLLASPSGVGVIRVAEAFFAKALALFLLSLFASSASAFLTIRAKSMAAALGISSVLILGLAIAEFVFQKVNIGGLREEDRSLILSLLPVFRVFFDPDPGFSWQSGMYCGVDALAAAGWALFCVRSARRQEI